MGDFEIIIGFIICAALIVWGSGWKMAVVQIAYIIAMGALYGLAQYIWPEYGIKIFLGLLILLAIIAFLFKEKLIYLLKRSK
ncbi:hypothetical protein RGQ13_10600 [Thalassotalea psychrophila]|uniref:Uncharacterized protein n=1 Tax=Thalassotalea psychrophila TaxID=3065647 RepID=A0ABY9TPU6_9GAMM|nr:hypothetical protein RGQ13_10600 [Colwelliaceae bacterium SQ149]